MWRYLLAYSVVGVIGCGNSSSVAPPDDPTLIGPLGGEVVSADGLAKLIVPPNALTNKVKLTISVSATNPLDAARVGKVYQIEPSTTTFATSAQLTLQFALSDIPAGALPAQLSMGMLTGGVVSAITGSSVDAAQSTISAAVSSAGSYGGVWSPAAACNSAEHRQFDFWLGHWRFDATGQPAGDQVITSIANGCGIRESFTQGTYRGSSVSLWNAATGKWSQTYVDSENSRRSLSGTRTQDLMILNETSTLRYVWRVVSPTLVEWTEERSTNAGASWQTTFSSTYTKIP